MPLNNLPEQSFTHSLSPKNCNSPETVWFMSEFWFYSYDLRISKFNLLSHSPSDAWKLPLWFFWIFLSLGYSSYNMVFSTFPHIAGSGPNTFPHLWSCPSLKDVQPGHTPFALRPEKSMKYFKYNRTTWSKRLLLSTFAKHVILFKVTKTY